MHTCSSISPTITTLRFLITQETHVENEDSETCQVGTCVLVDFVGRKASNRDDESGPIFHQANDLLVVVGDKDCLPALEMGIRFLREGSKGVIYSHSKYAYGNLSRVHGDYVLPENSNVIYQVFVKKVVEANDIEIAASRKEIANDCYKNEWSDGHGKNRPLYLYNKAGNMMKNVLVDTPDNETARSILVDCLNNTAAVYLRAKEYGKAKEAATLVLVEDPDNVKALCRAARAAMLDPAGSYEESEAAIATAETLKPNDPDVIKVRTELTRRKRDYKKKSKAAFSKLGASAGGDDKPKKSSAVSGRKSSQIEQPGNTSVNESKDGSDNDKTRELQSWAEILMPILIQMVVSFVGLFVFRYFLAKQQDMEGMQNQFQEDTNVDPTNEF